MKIRNFYSLTSVFFIFIFWFHSCAKESINSSHSYNYSDDKLIFESLDLIYLNEIGELLNEGDSIRLVDPESLENPMSLPSVHDLIYLVTNSELVLNSNVFSNPQDYSVSNVSESFLDYSIDFNISQKLESEDEDQDYIIESLRSGIRGNLTGKSWRIEEFNYQIQFGTAIIDLDGNFIYSVIINDIGLILKDYKQYKIILDVHTGQPINFILID